MSEICLRIKLFIFLIIMLTGICYDILSLCCPIQEAFFINQKCRGGSRHFHQGLGPSQTAKYSENVFLVLNSFYRGGPIVYAKGN